MRSQRPLRTAAAGLVVLVAACGGSDPGGGDALAGASQLLGPDAAADHAHLHDSVGGDAVRLPAHGAVVHTDHTHPALLGTGGSDLHAHLATGPGDRSLGDRAGIDADSLAGAQQRILEGLGPAAAAQSGAPSPWTVRYTADGEFVPERLDIVTGDEVIFVNESGVPVWPASNIHPTHEILPEFDPLAPIAPGGSWAFTFRRNGYWRYHNHVASAEGGLVVAAGGPEQALGPLNVEVVDVNFAPAPPAGTGGAELLSDEAALERFVLDYGPAAAVVELKALELATGEDCHSAAHEVGHIAYERFGAAVFRLVAHDCHAGVLHGAIEALFAERGTSRLAEDVSVLCSAAGNDFLVHQCYHGVGHGLLAWTTYELPEALQLCDLMPTFANRDACYGGVHMENGVGGLSGLMGHTTEYLDRDRPHFPCDILPEHHVPGCYFWQTSNLFWFGYEASDAARLCFEAPGYAQESCWWSMGRDLGSIHRDDPAAAASLCGLADTTEHLADCFQGAALSRFTEPANAPFSATLCALADAEEPPEVADACWEMVLRDARHIFPGAEAKAGFCRSLATSPRRQDCLTVLVA